MGETDLQLLERYSRERSEDAFTELVQRHIDLVHSAAFRQLQSPPLAEEVAQAVFVKLARLSSPLPPDTILSAWLYQVTRREAIDVVRREARRHAREQAALEMNTNAPNGPPDADWSQIEPLLDEAMEALDEPDRAAILLRYFENKSLRDVGQRLGASEDAAQKRVSRAVDRLRDHFRARGVAIGAGSLGTLLSTHAIQSAPAGLVTAVSASVGLASTATISAAAAVSAASVSTPAIVAMTTLQKSLLAAAAIAAIGAIAYQQQIISQFQRERAQTTSRLEAAVSAAQQAINERDAATNRLANAVAELARAKQTPGEVLKLRGQVGALRQEKTEIGNKSALNKITADPESRKMMRNQQKMGMAVIYTDLVKQLKLSPESTAKFHDVIADGVMDGIDLVTQALRDKKSRSEIDSMFAEHETAVRAKVAEVLGETEAGRYDDYSKDILSSLSTIQFASNLTGTDEARATKKSKLLEAMREATAAAQTAAGLSTEYQTTPMLNFRNIASEEQAEVSLKLVQDVYARVAERATGFLDDKELKSFKEFTEKAVENNRAALIMNRRLMAPIAP